MAFSLLQKYYGRKWITSTYYLCEDKNEAKKRIQNKDDHISRTKRRKNKDVGENRKKVKMREGYYLRKYLREIEKKRDMEESRKGIAESVGSRF